MFKRSRHVNYQPLSGFIGHQQCDETPQSGISLKDDASALSVSQFPHHVSAALPPYLDTRAACTRITHVDSERVDV